jgi:rSAM/selenodomain-associated transferase 2
MVAMGVSIIIPTLNEEGSLATTLRELRRQRPQEIVVADGGSTDRTCDAAKGADRFLIAPRGRASQMNAGAAHATGDILLFLHADCNLEDGALAAVERCLRRRDIAAGCFTMNVSAPGRLYRLIDDCATARVRLTGIAYGDQGLYLRRELFERLGGFPPLRLMEDVFFSRRLRRHGRIIVAGPRIFVSPRRWQRLGVVRQTLRNWALTALAAAGVHPDRLAAFYPSVR